MSAVFALLTTFGLGYLRPASGTWGSLPTVGLAAAIVAVGLGPPDHPVLYHVVLAVVFVLFCWATVAGGDRAEARWGTDPSNVVADETAGQCLALIALPIADARFTAFSLVLAFLAFRVCDILKPWPADAMQRLPGGWGILLDDIVAGLQALVIVQFVMRVV